MNAAQIFGTPTNDGVFKYMMCDVEIRKSVLRTACWIPISNRSTATSMQELFWEIAVRLG